MESEMITTKTVMAPTYLFFSTARITLNCFERRGDGWCRARTAMAYPYSLLYHYLNSFPIKFFLALPSFEGQSITLSISFLLLLSPCLFLLRLSIITSLTLNRPFLIFLISSSPDFLSQFFPSLLPSSSFQKNISQTLKSTHPSLAQDPHFLAALGKGCGE